MTIKHLTKKKHSVFKIQLKFYKGTEFCMYRVIHYNVNKHYENFTAMRLIGDYDRHLYS